MDLHWDSVSVRATRGYSSFFETDESIASQACVLGKGRV